MYIMASLKRPLGYQQGGRRCDVICGRWKSTIEPGVEPGRVNLNCQFGLTMRSRITWKTELLVSLCVIILVIVTEVGDLWAQQVGSGPNLNKEEKGSQTQTFVSTASWMSMAEHEWLPQPLEPGLLCHDQLCPWTVSQKRPPFPLSVLCLGILSQQGK